MASALQNRERKAIESTLRFANIKSLNCNEQVERCFKDLGDFKGRREFRASKLMNLDPSSWRDPSDRQRMLNSVKPYKTLQDIVRGWLGRIAGSGLSSSCHLPHASSGFRERLARARREVADEVAPEVRASVSTALMLTEGRLVLDYGFQSVSAVCAFAVALVLDEHRGLTSRLQKCGYSKCGRFRLDLDVKNRPRRFCNADHKERFDQETGADRQRNRRSKLREERS